jgi:hypothetical protein
MRVLLISASAIALATASPVFAQQPDPSPAADGRQIYTPADFAKFAPSNARDMLGQVPGFSLRTEDQARGLGEATANVLFNGARVTTKSEGVDAQLGRISIDRVVRIEIVDGATLGIPGLSGQVANVITRASGISGRFEYRAQFRPQYAKPNWIAGEASVSGTKGPVEWTLALTNNNGRGGAGGAAWAYSGSSALTQNRTVLIQNVNENPGVSGKLKWTGAGGAVANLNASYADNYSNNLNDEHRDLIAGVDEFRHFKDGSDGYTHELGGDIDFGLGSGRLKLIGLDQLSHSAARADAQLIFADHSATVGNRFTNRYTSGERIARAEYRWEMWGGSWQLDGEGAFNRYNQTAHLFELNADGTFSELPFPGGTGGVTEDRYESILTHSRTLAKGLTLQIGVGAEYSKISQTGGGGLEREFTRPKGSLTIAWTPGEGQDISFKLARTVGQLSFGDFLANVNLAQNNGNAGNVNLVPPQTWEADLEYKRDLNAFGSASVKLYGRHIDDYVDIIPVGLAESSGNIDTATEYGLSTVATIKLDPLGWRGAKVDLNGFMQHSSLKDPLTRRERPFSGYQDYGGELDLRWDVPETNWALGGGAKLSHSRANVRLFEVSTNYEGPIYSYVFAERKNLHGLTINVQAFNMTHGRLFFDRIAYTGLRDRSPIDFIERQRLNVSQIFRIQVKGNF